MLNKSLIKKIKFPSNIDFSFASVDSKNFLIFKPQTSTLKYILIPSCVSLQKIENFFLFKVLSKNFEDIDKYNFFISYFSTLIKSIDKPFKKRLILKGLGFRAALIENSKVLELKLGFSHSIKINIPTEDISLQIDKTFLLIEGIDRVRVGNFVNEIRNLKYPDSYKGKGFWYKNEIRNLKEVKKT